MLPIIKNNMFDKLIGTIDNNNNIKFFKKEDAIDFNIQEFSAIIEKDLNGNIKLKGLSVNLKINNKEN